MATSYNRASEIKAFDETKLGVKGLVDAGITKIPQFFIQPPEQGDLTSLPVEIPVIDLTGVDYDTVLRSEVVKKVVNHGIPLEVLDEMLEGVKRFHEAEVEVRKKYYTRDTSKKMLFNSNFDLYQVAAVSWRDSIHMTMAPEPPKPDELPVACRDITFEYATYIKKLGITLFELISEALGLGPNHLIEIECNKGLSVVGHCYPHCPEPHLTIGTAKHSDPFITVLLQDCIGGLQILYGNRWVDVPPLREALLVNLGDLLQLISNDKFKGVEHRVLASSTGPRISVASFFNSRANPADTRLLWSSEGVNNRDKPTPLQGNYSHRFWVVLQEERP